MKSLQPQYLLAVVLFFAMCFVTVSARQSTAADHDRPPNFVLIMADDLGAHELGCYGHPQHQTPHLDRLAETGVQFETAFTPPVCHPTRFLIMTGQYGCHNGIYNFPGKRGGPPNKGRGVDRITNHFTFGPMLQAAGYATAMVGKWQLSGEPPNLIYEAGFDEYCTWAYRNYYTDEQRQKAQDAGVAFRSRYWKPSIIRNGDWVPTTWDDYGPDIFADFVIDFAKRKREQPFFIYYPMVLTHTPWRPTPDTAESLEQKKTKSRKLLRDNVEYTDKVVGRIVAALEQMGLRENTILIFTGDNGTGGDGKSTATERGARVPMIVNAPGLVKPRGATKQLTDLSDVFPTLAELAGVEVMQQPLDGRSLAPFLRGQTDHTRDWIFAYQADRRILRTGRYLLEDNSPLHYGTLYDCGDSRDGTGYTDVTDSKSPEVLRIKKQFDRLLERLPAPYIPVEGKPNQKTSELHELLETAETSG